MSCPAVITLVVFVCVFTCGGLCCPDRYEVVNLPPLLLHHPSRVSGQCVRAPARHSVTAKTAPWPTGGCLPSPSPRSSPRSRRRSTRPTRAAAEVEAERGPRVPARRRRGSSFPHLRLLFELSDCMIIFYMIVHGQTGNEELDRLGRLLQRWCQLKRHCSPTT